MIAQAEQLKKELTDKFVVVSQSVPELRRFVGLTGRVKTVNMNCRALVQFDGPVDISWYDIDPSFLTVVDAPLPKEKKEEKEAPKAEKKAPAKASGGMSPLEMARKQGAVKAEGAGDSGKKLSPLELARQQGAAGKSEAAADGGKKLSPLELARQQGAAKAEAEQQAPVEEPAPEPVVETPAEEVVEATESAPSSGGLAATPGSTAEIIALARQQGAFKG